jgi:carbon storage regulator
MIGDDIVITVLGVKGSHVRIGIKAPKNVAVHRQEIFEAIQREQIDVDEEQSPAEPPARQLY